MLGRLEHIVQTDRAHITIQKYVAALLILRQVTEQIDFWGNIKTRCPNLRTWEEREAGGKAEMSVCIHIHRLGEKKYIPSPLAFAALSFPAVPTSSAWWAQQGQM